MTSTRVLLFFALMAPLSVIVVGSANYSVQLLEGLIPAGWSAEDWAAAADTMIGKTQAHILSDLIEDLGIDLEVSEQSIRESLDEDRIALGLEPLPPYEDHGPRGWLTKYPKNDGPEAEFANYLPPGWTEEKLQDYTHEDFMELATDVRTNLLERLTWDLEILKANPNPGYFAELPKDVKAKITDAMHEATRQQANLGPGVRAYKRAVAPIVQVVTLQNYDEFGFMLCRTSFSNETLWEEAFENLNGVFEEHLLTEGDYFGTGLELIADKFLFPIEDDDSFEGASMDDCRKRFQYVKDLDAVPLGIDVGIVLMADEKSLRSIAEPSRKNISYVWAVDVTFDPEKTTYPDGYKGFFEVRTHALMHDLYVALGSGMMAPVDVWKLLNKTTPNEDAGVGKHDEL